MPVSSLPQQVPPRRQPSVHDGLAITGFILAFFLPLVGLILSWVSVANAHRAGRQASGLAVAGLVIGLVATVIITVVIIVAAVTAGDQVSQTNAYLNCLNAQLNNPSVVCNPPQ